MLTGRPATVTLRLLARFLAGFLARCVDREPVRWELSSAAPVAGSGGSAVSGP
jgi:uncharacterized glyoxalase superfamily protein PhnB